MNDVIAMISQEKLSNISYALKNGLLIVYPTDTLYGIGADIFNKQAVEKVFLVKQRPHEMPLPIGISAINKIDTIAYMSPLAEKIASFFLPGSLTLILKQKALPTWIQSSKGTIAIRIPNDPIALQILSHTGPLTITSANVHNQSTPLLIKDISKMFKSNDIALFIDDGIRCGNASTIVDCTTHTPIIIRQGSISPDEIDSVVNDK